MATIRSRTPAQMFTLVFGIVYLLIGLVGFGVTGFDNFAGETYDDKLLLFPINPLHNLVHLGVGAVWLFSANRHATAKSMSLIIGVVYGLVAALGFAGILNFLAIKGAGSADNFLHLVTSLLGLYFGTVGAAGPRASAGK